MVKARRRSQRRGKNDALGYGLIGGTSIIVIAAIFWIWRLDQSAVRLDPDSLCPIGGPHSMTTLLADVTDPLTPAQIRDFRNQYDRLFESVPRYGALEVYVVRDTSTALIEPVLSVCNPGRGEDISELTANPEKLERQWQEKFKVPVEEAYLQIIQHTDANRSPILESVQSVSLTSLPRASRQTQHRRLVVFSDFMQHTDALSFYKRSLPTAEELAQTPSFNRTRIDLRGVDVDLWIIYRTEVNSQKLRDLATLWDEIFTLQGGQVQRIYNVTG
jgi:hypothetical protein